MYVQLHASNRENWYVSFCAFIAWDFKILLLPFQSDRPMIIFFIQKCNHCYEIWWWNLHVQSTWLRSQLLSDCMSLCRSRLIALWKAKQNSRKMSQILCHFCKLFSHRAKCLLQLFLTDHPSRLDQKWGDGTLNKMTKPGVYHDWTTKKVFEM